jgi:hypothetical protein
MIPLTWLKLSSDILHSKETENDKNKNKKHVDRAKGWTGFAKTCGQSKRFAKTCGQSKRLDRVRQNMWTEHKG